MGDVLLIDAEGGKETIIQTDRIEHKERIQEIRVTDYKTVAHIHDWLKAHCYARDRNDVAQLKKLQNAVFGTPIDQIVEPIRFRTVIIDSLYEVENYSNYAILGINQDDLIQDDMPVSGWPEFRKNLESVKLLCRAFRDLPMHTIFTCVAAYKQDERKRNFYVPALTGQLAKAVQGFVSMVGFLVMDQPKAGKEGVMIDAPRKLFVQPIAGFGANFQAKNRYASFKGSAFDDPTMTQIMGSIGLLKPSTS